MAAELRARIVLDDNPFQKSVKRVKSSGSGLVGAFAGFGRSMTGKILGVTLAVSALGFAIYKLKQKGVLGDVKQNFDKVIEATAGLRRLALAIGIVGVGLRALKASSGAARSAVTGVTSTMARSAISIKTLAASLTVAGLALVGLNGLKDAGIQAFGGAGEMEQTSIAFETMLGSAREASRVLGDLTQFADVTPFDTAGVIAAGRSLLAFSTPTKDLIGDLRKIGDVASGVSAPLGEIAEIYGKARIQGTLFAEDINQLTGRGIPVIQEFAKQLGVSESQVKSLGGEGKIRFANLESAFASLTGEGGRFFNLMERQSGTISGLFSTLKSKVSALLIAFATPINEALKPLMSSLLVIFPDLIAKAKAFGQIIADQIKKIPNMIQTLQGIFADPKAFFSDLGGVFSSLFSALKDGLTGAFLYAVSVAAEQMAKMLPMLNINAGGMKDQASGLLAKAAADLKSFGKDLGNVFDRANGRGSLDPMVVSGAAKKTFFKNDRVGFKGERVGFRGQLPIMGDNGGADMRSALRSVSTSPVAGGLSSVSGLGGAYGIVRKGDGARKKAEKAETAKTDDQKAKEAIKTTEGTNLALNIANKHLATIAEAIA